MKPADSQGRGLGNTGFMQRNQQPLFYCNKFETNTNLYTLYVYEFTTVNTSECAFYLQSCTPWSVAVTVQLVLALRWTELSQFLLLQFISSKCGEKFKERAARHCSDVQKLLYKKPDRARLRETHRDRSWERQNRYTELHTLIPDAYTLLRCFMEKRHMALNLRTQLLSHLLSHTYLCKYSER